MKVLFSHDGPIYKDRKGNYYSVSLTGDILSRYIKKSDELKLLIRLKDVADSKTPIQLSRISLENLEVISCPSLSSLHDLIANIKNTNKIIHSHIEKADRLIVRLPSLIGYMSIRAAIRMKKPYLVELVACPWDDYGNHSLKGRLFAPLAYAINRKYIKKASYVLYVTNNYLQKRYPTKGNSIGCSDVALTTYSDDIISRRLAKIENMNENKPIKLGTLGAVHIPTKGHRYVIEAIALAYKHGYKYEYYIVGGGDNSYLRELADKKGVSDKVKFLGSLQHDKVFEFLDQIDIYIQPSLNEGLPRALIEAMSRGCPAIGSRIPGNLELIEASHTFKRASSKQLYRLLVRMNSKCMINASIRNYNAAKQYDDKLLEKKRSEFYDNFLIGEAMGKI